MANLDPLMQQNALLGGKYRLGPVIGSGGVATVYRATHVWTEREVAVKVLDPTLPHYDRLREGFLREARATVQLHHPNVVDVLDMGEHDGEPAYLVMELLDGPTLRDVLLEQGQLGEDDTLSILLPLIDALERAHELGVVHRDFKPENIMLTLDAYGAPTPKLLDFGVAEVLQDLRSRYLSSTNGVIMGTPQYMSPEQARDQRRLIGPHTDVWGVGVVWYECLTGHAPFDGDSAPDILQAVCDQAIDFEAVPEAYVPLLRDALNRSTELRIGSLSELKARIEEMGVATTSTPPPSPTLSSWPSPAPRDSQVRQTLTGLGPKEILQAASTLQRASTSQRASIVQRAPTARPVDSEPIQLRTKSNRKAALGGLALATAVAFAAWWTVRTPEQSVATPTEPLVEEVAVPPERIEPSPAPTSMLPPAPTEVAPPVETAPEEASSPPSLPAPDPLVEPEPTTVKARKPAVRKSRSKAAPASRRRAPPSEASQRGQVPGLVTEW